MPPDVMQSVEELREQSVAEQATGCCGAGDYRRWAREQGYPHLAVFDWTSSAGDWTFIVSQDGREWFVMTQSNNYPRQGFTRTVDDRQSYCGDAQRVLQDLADELDW